jgi:hypothetical protein
MFIMLTRHLLYHGLLFGLCPTLKMEMIRSYESSVQIRTARRRIPDDVDIQQDVVPL